MKEKDIEIASKNHFNIGLFPQTNTITSYFLASLKTSLGHKLFK